MCSINNGALKRILLAAVTAGLWGCAATTAPKGYLPEEAATQWEVCGGWLKVEYSNEGIACVADGELLAAQDRKIYILKDSQTVVILSDSIQKATLDLHLNQASTIGIWTFLGSLSTLSHGFVMVLSLPTWLLVGIPSATFESWADHYVQEKPDEAWWNKIKKFCRFPQGIPSGVGLYKLRPKNLSPSPH
jgi:hypothetical protein